MALVVKILKWCHVHCCYWQWSSMVSLSWCDSISSHRASHSIRYQIYQNQRKILFMKAVPVRWYTEFKFAMDSESTWTLPMTASAAAIIIVQLEHRLDSAPYNGVIRARNSVTVTVYRRGFDSDKFDCRLGINADHDHWLVSTRLSHVWSKQNSTLCQPQSTPECVTPLPTPPDSWTQVTFIIHIHCDTTCHPTWKPEDPRKKDYIKLSSCENEDSASIVTRKQRPNDDYTYIEWFNWLNSRMTVFAGCNGRILTTTLSYRQTFSSFNCQGRYGNCPYKNVRWPALISSSPNLLNPAWFGISANLPVRATVPVSAKVVGEVNI